MDGPTIYCTGRSGRERKFAPSFAFGSSFSKRAGENRANKKQQAMLPLAALRRDFGLGAALAQKIVYFFVFQPRCDTILYGYLANVNTHESKDDL